MHFCLPIFTAGVPCLWHHERDRFLFQLLQRGWQPLTIHHPGQLGRENTGGCTCVSLHMLGFRLDFLLGGLRLHAGFRLGGTPLNGALFNPALLDCELKQVKQMACETYNVPVLGESGSSCLCKPWGLHASYS